MTARPPDPTRARPEGGARGALLAALVAVAALVVTTAREVVIGRDELVRADAEAARSNWQDAIEHARAAAEARAPGSPWPERGFRRLDAIGRDAEARGDRATALSAYGAIRTAAVATRAPGSSATRWRSAAEDALARLDVPTSGARAAGDRDSALAAVRRDEAPPAWALGSLAASALATVAGLARLLVVARVGQGARLARGLTMVGVVVYVAVMLTN